MERRGGKPYVGDGIIEDLVGVIAPWACPGFQHPISARDQLLYRME